MKTIYNYEADPLSNEADPLSNEADPLTYEADPLSNEADPFSNEADPLSMANSTPIGRSSFLAKFATLFLRKKKFKTCKNKFLSMVFLKTLFVYSGQRFINTAKFFSNYEFTSKQGEAVPWGLFFVSRYMCIVYPCCFKAW